MSTLHTANLFPTWKQEVNRRVADHRNRKNATADTAEPQPENHSAPSVRAANAAARVAARFANAPSYNQLLVGEVRNAMRAANAAREAAEQADAAAQMVLAGLELLDAAEPESPATLANGSMHPVPSIREERSVPAAASTETAPMSNVSVLRAQNDDRHSSQGWSDPFDWDQMTLPACRDIAEQSAAVERPQPVHDNVIPFPREMVAARRMRPRRIEGPLAEHESVPQLSIFEIDPQTISTLPSSLVTDEPAAPTWMRPEWPAAAIEAETQEEPTTAPVVETSKSAIVDLAPLGRRVVASLVDGSLNLAAFAGVIALAGHGSRLLHNPRAFGVCAMLLLLLVCAAYQALFSLAEATPGMWFAGIGLCTLNGHKPQQAQRGRRLMALPLSVLPLGLGLAWSLFDADHLTWHDRLSETYLRLR